MSYIMDVHARDLHNQRRLLLKQGHRPARIVVPHSAPRKLEGAMFMRLPIEHGDVTAPEVQPLERYTERWLREYDEERRIGLGQTTKFRPFPKVDLTPHIDEVRDFVRGLVGEVEPWQMSWVDIGLLHKEAVAFEAPEDRALRYFATIPWKDPAPVAMTLTMQAMQETLCLLWGSHETRLDLRGDERCARCGSVMPWVLGSE